MASDIRDILDLDRSDVTVSSNEKVKKKIIQSNTTKTSKRPEGMAREVYALLYNDSKDIPPLIPTDTDQSYKHTKAKLGMKKVRPWKWMPFKNPARTDDAVFYHWRRAIEEGKEYPFGKFNKKVEIPQYTDAEYIEYLKSDDWSREDTDHLFDLCQRFDLRFIVIHDRFDNEKYKPRTIEDLKDRYYFVVNTLYKVRHVPGTPYVEPKAFDADHERRRKEQLRRLFDRTPEQVEEEQMLMQELRKIEVRKKERERKAQDLQKLITGTDSAYTENRKQEKRPMQKRKIQGQLKNRTNSNHLEMVGIKFPDFRTSGASLRSARMRLPTNVGQKKIKVIEQALKELELDANFLLPETNPVPTEETCALFNELRSDIVVLNEMRNALTTCLFEIQTFKHQYEALKPGKTLEIPEILYAPESSNVEKNDE